MFQRLYLLDSNSTFHFVPTVMYTAFLACEILLRMYSAKLFWKP